jgi:HTH-type transcriptional regulator / antitoxin HipB
MNKVDFKNNIEVNSSAKLGLVIKETRQKLGLKQQDVAFVAHVGVRFMSDLENGKPTCQIEKIFQVAHSLGIKINFVSPVKDINND